MPDFATPSVPDSFEEIDVLPQDYITGPDFDVSAGAANIYTASSPEVLFLDEDAKYENIVTYEGTFNGQSVQLVIPYSEYANLCVIDGVLVNVSNNTVQGRFLYGNDTISPSEYETYTYNLQPIYGSTNNVYNRGSFNYERHYYLDTSSSYDRITYDDTYGNFAVQDVTFYYTSSERSYYALFIIIFFLGVMIICLRRRR